MPFPNIVNLNAFDVGSLTYLKARQYRFPHASTAVSPGGRDSFHLEVDIDLINTRSLEFN